MISGKDPKGKTVTTVKSVFCYNMQNFQHTIRGTSKDPKCFPQRRLLYRGPHIQAPLHIFCHQSQQRTEEHDPEMFKIDLPRTLPVYNQTFWEWMCLPTSGLKTCFGTGIWGNFWSWRAASKKNRRRVCGTPNCPACHLMVDLHVERSLRVTCRMPKVHW